MEDSRRVPEGIRNEAQWVKSCCRVCARARELVGGKLSLFAAAQALQRLQFETRAKDDEDFLIFRKIWSELGHLPVGPEREHWSRTALAREDPKIHALEIKWYPIAAPAARRLLARCLWAYERRAELRQIARAAGQGRMGEKPE